MMQAAPALSPPLSPPLSPSSALPGQLRSKRDESTANIRVGRRTPSRETGGDVDRREMETGSGNSTTTAADSARRAPPDATEDSMPNSTNASGSAPTTALPGIRDLFPGEFRRLGLSPIFILCISSVGALDNSGLSLSSRLGANWLRRHNGHDGASGSRGRSARYSSAMADWCFFDLRLTAPHCSTRDAGGRTLKRDARLWGRRWPVPLGGLGYSEMIDA
ncbi:uncharacterized protein FOMMEDRAFT_157791 [Fomitiporia mediterranea MF3/22]|uniref:uncharacterized protein n=1 Tax=Fomitiporia mediterranea (strain MF3/22) TaxID=694068 RepID=UPI0004408354|nr:uncharacterized protein FOMMEDRAFT_157791 [Fomitiporia mediterranea MF3/22]EJD00694.1 hypothetical protein FOMMEDRAFT_157791 [Fomitiporia mediterranea MF3/22]